MSIDQLPASFDHYWRMWNETDLDKVRYHLERAVADGVIFGPARASHNRFTGGSGRFAASATPAFGGRR